MEQCGIVASRQSPRTSKGRFGTRSASMISGAGARWQAASRCQLSADTPDTSSRYRGQRHPGDLAPVFSHDRNVVSLPDHFWLFGPDAMRDLASVRFRLVFIRAFPAEQIARRNVAGQMKKYPGIQATPGAAYHRKRGTPHPFAEHSIVVAVGSPPASRKLPRKRRPRRVEGAIVPQRGKRTGSQCDLVH